MKKFSYAESIFCRNSYSNHNSMHWGSNRIKKALYVMNFIFTLLTAVTIAISARTVGTLVISSLMVLLVAAAMQIAKSYKQTMVYSVIIGVISTVSGLFVVLC